MPARTLNDFFAGFFYGQNKADLEVNMLITKQKGQRKGDVKEVQVKGESNQEKEVIVHHEPAPRMRGKSTWNWHEEFTLEWNKNFIIKNKKRNPK
jgi:sporulation protein YlmC with PRC-barrel domain